MMRAKIAGSQRDLVRWAGPELEVALTRGLDNVGIGYSKVILIVRATHTLSSQCHRAVHNSYCLLKTDVLR